MNRSRSLSAENLHRRIRGPRRYTAGQTATASRRDSSPLASFRPASEALRLHNRKPRKLNVNVFEPSGFTDGSRRLCTVRSKTFTASLPAPSFTQPAHRPFLNNEPACLVLRGCSSPGAPSAKLSTALHPSLGGALSATVRIRILTSHQCFFCFVKPSGLSAYPRLFTLTVQNRPGEQPPKMFDHPRFGCSILRATTSKPRRLFWQKKNF